MVFTSITFIFILLPVFLGLYYLAPKRLKNSVLLLLSLFFYTWGQPLFVLLLILSILVNYIIGREMYMKRGYPQKAKYVLLFGIVLNVGIFVFFKYYVGTLDLIRAIFNLNLYFRDLILPFGFAFYTLKTISYLVDLYRERVTVQRNIINFALFVSFFPPLLAGPINGYAEMEAQLESRELSFEKFGSGCILFIFGFGKVVILSGAMARIFTTVLSLPMGTFSVVTAWIGIIAFGFYLYYMLSGFADIASGLAKMFGFEFQKNFDYPFTAKGFPEFWRRWFISIGNWMRDYVFLPIYTKYPSPVGYVLVFSLVWILIGTWFGSTLNFLIWGIYNLIILLMHEYVLGESFLRLPNFVQRILTFIFISIGWVFFSFTDLGYAFTYLQVMFGGGAHGFIDSMSFHLLSSNWLFIVFVLLGASPRGLLLIHNVTNAFLNNKVRRFIVCVIYAAIFLVSTAYLVTDVYDPLVLFRF